MHTYSTDSGYRITIPAVIGVLSYLTIQYFDILRFVFPSFGLIEGWVPSFGIVMTLLFVIFNKWIWKIPLLQKLGIVSVPNLNGSWEVTGHTHRPESNTEEEFSAEVTISQRWRSIIIDMETDDSRSTSLGATILTEEGTTPILTYHYLNEPKPNSPDGMNPHRGTATLYFQEENGQAVLEGEYYTGGARRTYGRLRFVRSEYG